MNRLLTIFVLFNLLISSNLKEGSSGKSPSELKLEIPKGAIPINYRNHIYITGLLDSVSGNFVFDTGADNLYIDTLFYKQHNFHYENLVQATIPGAGNGVQHIQVVFEPVRFNFANCEYSSSQVPLLSLKPILGDFADGILGRDFFENKVLAVNYQHQYMKIYEHIDSVNTADYTRIQCENIKNRLYLTLKVQIDDSLEIEGGFLLLVRNFPIKIQVLVWH